MKQLDFIFGPHRTVGQAYIFSEERPRAWDHFLVMVCFTGVEGNYRSGRKKCLAGWKVQNDEQRVNFRLWPTECCKIANVGKSMKKSDGNIVDVFPEVIQNLVESSAEGVLSPTHASRSRSRNQISEAVNTWKGKAALCKDAVARNVYWSRRRSKTGTATPGRIFYQLGEGRKANH